MASYPDLVAYRCIAVTLGQAGHMRELFHVIDSMKSPPKMKLSTGVLQKWDPRLEPDIIVYNAVSFFEFHRSFTIIKYLLLFTHFSFQVFIYM